METSALASMMAIPREGHLDQVYRMCSFLKSHHNAVMVFDPTPPELDLSILQTRIGPEVPMVIARKKFQLMLLSQQA